MQSQSVSARKAVKQLKIFPEMGSSGHKIEKWLPQTWNCKNCSNVANVFSIKRNAIRRSLISFKPRSSKGKVGKKFDFEPQMVLLPLAKAIWIVGTEAYLGNPYDGHTLFRIAADVQNS